MQTNQILEAIDQQISKLKRARDLLAGSTAVQAEAGKRRGRPTGSKVAANEERATPLAKKANPPMSAEGRARIAAAQKARWATQKKADQPAKPTAKKTATKPKAAKKKASPAEQSTTPPDTEPVIETPAADA